MNHHTLFTVFVFVCSATASAGGERVSLADLIGRSSVRHHQQWGRLGVNAAASAHGQGSVLRIGKTTYRQGIGHHARGEISVDLDGRYRSFHALAGVQWQGGGKGSVVFRVLVDGRVAFESGRMTDSSPPQTVQVDLRDAKKMLLVADDTGDSISCDMADWVDAWLDVDPEYSFSAAAAFFFNGEEGSEPVSDGLGFFFIGTEQGPQAALTQPRGHLTVSVKPAESVKVVIPLHTAGKPLTVRAKVLITEGESAEAALFVQGEAPKFTVLKRGENASTDLALQWKGAPVHKGSSEVFVCLETRGISGETGISWCDLDVMAGTQKLGTVFRVASCEGERFPLQSSPSFRRGIGQALIEWDWRLQDGIDTPREARTFRQAVSHTIDRTGQLLEHLQQKGVDLAALSSEWKAAGKAWRLLEAKAAAGTETGQSPAWEELWRKVHRLRRRIVFRNPAAETGPVLFVKRAPSAFSHQLTQYASRHARAGGGLFVLKEPGRSMNILHLTPAFPAGSFQHADVSFDGRKILFSFCPVHRDPEIRSAAPNEHQAYHIFEMNADGTACRQLTRGRFDDFSARYLPGGGIVFLSTRRGGFHRCGRGPCHVHTLAAMNADGSEPRVISFHETHEWDPVVLHNGRVIYTRWDYVDRHAVHYQQLWTTRPDGTDVRIFYGNNTLNPVGVWEARPVPGSELVMATAAAHHAMTAGSIILLDTRRGVDGLAPITRLTPDVLFPESEVPVAQWHAPVGVVKQPPVPVEERRWPGHCYRSPYPLSESLFIAAYSFKPLIGEPHPNPPDMFGLYLVDRFGNRELLYRDSAVGSLWPMPLRQRIKPAELASCLDPAEQNEGSFFLHNVYESWPSLPEGKADRIAKLRIVQVLPKSTPHANDPRVGLANASPGKQVLGTVPVERDGSAYFRAPAGIPLAFQALDRQGRAVQIMRTVVYLQPGENASCVGCHERRAVAPANRSSAKALLRPPSPITAGPKGSKPFSYPQLVQPVLDKHCIRCHNGAKADGGVVLTGAPQGAFTVSYNTLAPLVPFPQWEGGAFRTTNSEPLARPDFFGARASRLTRLLNEKHGDVELSPDEWERLITWMDTNALFYGTFNRNDQERQRRGEQIAGPELE